jgi:hypothetical protein
MVFLLFLLDDRSNRIRIRASDYRIRTRNTASNNVPRYPSQHEKNYLPVPALPHSISLPLQFEALISIRKWLYKPRRDDKSLYLSVSLLAGLRDDQYQEVALQAAQG